MTQFPKTCSCCKKVYSAEEWVRLRWDGTADMMGEVLEFRTCGCGSTLTIDVTPRYQRSITPVATGWSILPGARQ